MLRETNPWAVQRYLDPTHRTQTLRMGESGSCSKWDQKPQWVEPRGCGQTLLGSIRTPMIKIEVGGFVVAQVPSPDPMSLLCPFMSLICPLCPHLCPEKFPGRDPRFPAEGRGKIGQGRAVKNIIWAGTKCHSGASGEGQSGLWGTETLVWGHTPRKQLPRRPLWIMVHMLVTLGCSLLLNW